MLNDRKDKATRVMIDIAYLVMVLLISYVCYKLFGLMIENPGGNYKSDIPYYIKRATEGAMNLHRFEFVLFSFLYKLTDSPDAIQVFLAVEMALIFFANYVYIKYYADCDTKVNRNRALVQILSVAAVFAGPIFVPKYHPTFYKNTFAIFAWHSPTQQALTLFAVIATLFFLLMFRNYEDGIDPKWWIGSAVFFFLSAYAKPSYILDFVPAVVVVFLIELILKARTSFADTFKKLFIMGLSLVPSGLYMIILNYIIYQRPDRKGDSDIVVDSTNIGGGIHMYIAICCCMAFPLLVTLINWKKIFKDRRFALIVLVAIAGVLQWGLLGESGSRANHGNFGWGRTIGGYMYFLTCIAMAAENFIDRNFMSNKKALRTAYFSLLLILMAMHVISQIIYFYTMYNGAGFWR